MKIIYAFIFILLLQNILNAQVTGTVTDESGDPLEFVTVYSAEVMNGTVTNEKGEYTLPLKDGEHTIVFKFVGYEDVSKTINLSGSAAVDATMKVKAVTMDELLITADAEDPAYRVIRKAIEKRPYYQNEVEQYTVDLYTKGLMRITKRPDNFLGNQMGDLGGMLDSTGRGIVYLAESKSHFSYMEPDYEKETMYASKVAEGEDAFNFNRFMGKTLQIYDEYTELEKSIVNPLADNALSFYKYRLLSAKPNESGQLINRIQIITKNEDRPTFFGEIYIEEDTWRVTEFILSIKGRSIGESFLDTLQIKQILRTESDSYSVPISQVSSLGISAFGLKVKGNFTYLFSDYNFSPGLTKDDFSSEVFLMEDGATKSDTNYWKVERPVSLSVEEKDNYILKDSLTQVWKSKSFLDSTDRADNKFGAMNLLAGYTHRNSYNKRYHSFGAPLSMYSFDPVTGHQVGLSYGFEKENKTETKSFEATMRADYGLGDQRLKYVVGINIDLDRKSWSGVQATLGDNYYEYNNFTPIGSRLGTALSLFSCDNPRKLYRKRFANITYGREVMNGLYARARVEYSRRSPLTNLTKYNEHPSNHPFFDRDVIAFQEHDMFTLSSVFRITPFQKYQTYERFKLRYQSKWPQFFLRYRLGRGSEGRAFQKISLALSKSVIDMKVYGRSRLYLEAGHFLQSDNVPFMDMNHFGTNVSWIGSTGRRFLRMPQYEYASTEDYMTGYYEHDFRGYLTGFIPGVKRLGWSIAAGSNALVRPSGYNYYEFNIGFKNVKIGFLNLGRIDYVRSYTDTGFSGHSVVWRISAFSESIAL